MAELAIFSTTVGSTGLQAAAAVELASSYAVVGTTTATATAAAGSAWYSSVAAFEGMAAASAASSVVTLGELATSFGQTGFKGIQAAGQLISAVGRKQEYDAKAAEARYQGTADYLKYRQQAVETLRKMNETLATQITRAALSMDPFSGSALTLQADTLNRGASTYQMTQDNAQIVRNQAERQAQQYEAAGDTTMVAGLVGATGSVAEGVYTDSVIGNPALKLNPGA